MREGRNSTSPFCRRYSSSLPSSRKSHSNPESLNPSSTTLGESPGRKRGFELQERRAAQHQAIHPAAHSASLDFMKSLSVFTLSSAMRWLAICACATRELMFCALRLISSRASSSPRE